MCEPLTITAFALMAASAAAGLKGQRDQAQAVEHAQDRNLARTEINAAEAAANSYSGSLSRLVQERQSAALEINTDAREARSARATSRSRGAASGVAGILASDVRQNIDLQNAEFFAARQRQLEWNTQQILASMESVRSQQQNRVLGALGGPVRQPNYLGTILGLGGQGLSLAAQSGGSSTKDPGVSKGRRTI